MTDTPTPPTPEPIPPKPPGERSEQDQQMANDLGEAGQLLAKIAAGEEIRTLLAARGYAAAELAEGTTLHSAANAAFQDRQSALARQRSASEAVATLEAKVRETFGEFRQTVTTVLPKPDWTALGATGRVPADTQKFITAVRGAYNAGKKAPYAETLAKYGYPAVTLDADLAMLEAFATTDGAHETAMGAAKQATTDRNAAFKALDKWLKQFKPIARLALKSKPGLVKELKL